MLVLEELLKELLDFHLGLFENLLSESRGEVHLTHPAVGSRAARSKPTSFFHSVQERVHRSGSNFVPMPTQFVDHPEPKNSFGACMVQHMHADESRKDIGISCYTLRCRQENEVLVILRS
jgi:hypothetical protein